MANRRFHLLLLSLCLALSLAACGDSDLEKVAKGLSITAQSIGTAQSLVIELNKQGFINDGETRTVLEACLEVNKAGKAAVDVTRNLTTLDESSRAKLLNLIIPVVGKVADAVAQTQYITDTAKRNEIRAILLTVQSALAGIQVILVNKQQGDQTWNSHWQSYSFLTLLLPA